MNPKGGGGAAGPEVFARDDHGKVVHLWWDGAKFTDFTKLGDQDAGGDPFGWTRADNSGEVYVIGADGQLMKSDRDATGAWSTWASIGSGPYDTCAKPIHHESGQGGGSPHPTGPSSGAGANSSGVGGAGGGADGDSPGHDGACSCRVGESGNVSASWAWLGLALIPTLRRSRRRRR
jgi:MYXO-CTERM domain-containing protein